MITYQIYQLVGGFSAKFVSSRISQNIFFHMIIRASISFERGAFPKTGLYLQSLIAAINQDVVYGYPLGGNPGIVLSSLAV